MPRAKMQIQDRAKQFAPFSALNGLDEALAQKRRELERTDRRIFIDYGAERINRRLSALKKGMPVYISHYLDGEYKKTSGTVTDIRIYDGTILLDDIKIDIESIADIIFLN